LERNSGKGEKGKKRMMVKVLNESTIPKTRACYPNRKRGWTILEGGGITRKKVSRRQNYQPKKLPEDLTQNGKEKSLKVRPQWWRLGKRKAKQWDVFQIRRRGGELRESCFMRWLCKKKDHTERPKVKEKKRKGG